MPEWLKGTDCKSVIFGLRWFESIPAHHFYRGVEQSVARRAHNPKVVGSSPAPATNCVGYADVAQSVERILGKDKVTSSILVISSIYGGIAQLARANGSYPLCPEFKSLCRHHNEIKRNCVSHSSFFYTYINYRSVACNVQCSGAA